MSKFIKALKTGIEYFIAASGVAGFLLTVVGSFVVIAPVVSLPIACGIGLIFGYYGSSESWRAQTAREAQAAKDLTTQQDVQAIKTNVAELKKEIELSRREELSSEPSIMVVVDPENDVVLVNEGKVKSFKKNTALLTAQNKLRFFRDNKNEEKLLVNDCDFNEEMASRDPERAFITTP